MNAEIYFLQKRAIETCDLPEHQKQLLTDYCDRTYANTVIELLNLHVLFIDKPLDSIKILKKLTGIPLMQVRNLLEEHANESNS